MTSRRTEKTIEALRAAMLELLREKPFDKISVKELVDRAGVCKNTLYSYYDNLHDLVRDCYLSQEIFFGSTRKLWSDYGSRREAAFEVLDTMARRLLFFKNNPNMAKVVLYNVGISPYFNGILHEEIDFSINNMKTEFGSPFVDYLDIEQCARFIYLGVNAVFREWYEAGMVEDIEKVVKCAIHCAFHSFGVVAGRGIEPEYLQAIAEWRFEK